VVTSAQKRTYRGGCNALYAWGFVLAAFLPMLTGCEGFVAQNCNSDGVQYFQQSRYQDALREFQEAAYADPTNADAYYNLAAVYHRMGSAEHNRSYYDQAETNYNLCLDRNPNHTDCYRGLAVLLIEEGRSDKAFRLVEGWVARSPNVADARIELARLNEEFGNRQAAKDHLVEALTIQSDNPRALAALGKIREDSGETAQALANYQRSLQYDSQQPQVASRVAALQSRSGIYTPTTTLDTSAAQLANRSSTTTRY
jgi:tetratricopeptide (TPR) repeat protein